MSNNSHNDVFKEHNKVEIEEKKEKKKVSLKWLFLTVMLGVILVIFLFFIGDFRESVDALKRIDPFWFFLSCICVFLFWFTEAMTIKMTSRIAGVKLSLFRSFDTSMVGQFYNAVTPFATGGQPMQIFRLYQYGIDVSKGTAIMLSRFLIYQSTITVVGVFIMFFFFDKMNQLPSFSLLAPFGFIVNSAVIFFLLVFSFSPKLTHKIFDLLLKIVSPFKFGKKMKENEEKWIEKIRMFHSAMKLLKTRPYKLLLAVFFTSMQVFFFFSIPYCIYRMFEAPVTPFLEIFSFQGILFLIISFVPVPGAGGAAEGGFYLFFKEFFSPASIAGGVLLWRMMSYYFNIFFGVWFAMRDPTKKIKRKER